MRKTTKILAWLMAALMLMFIVPSATAIPSGNWVLKFEDNFNSLDAAKWKTNWYGEGHTMNKVANYSRNVSVANGNLQLKLEGYNSGALVHTDFTGGARVNVGDYTEARIMFPTSPDGRCANWPAWWANTLAKDKWPSQGEHDIAEVLSGKLTVNYHSPSGSHNQGSVSGSWCGSWHTYGLHRKSGSADVYWDGKLVKSYKTDDGGKPEMLILNMGRGGSSNTVYGASLLVDYVRIWRKG